MDWGGPEPPQVQDLAYSFEIVDCSTRVLGRLRVLHTEAMPFLSQRQAELRRDGVNLRLSPTSHGRKKTGVQHTDGEGRVVPALAPECKIFLDRRVRAGGEFVLLPGATSTLRKHPRVLAHCPKEEP